METTKKTILKKFIFQFILTLFLGALPVLLSFLGFSLIDLLDCSISGGTVVECPGHQSLAETLGSMILLHWLGIITIPLALLGAVIVFIKFVVQWIRR